ncbi:B-cell receptor CD22-like isoform 2-T3 [Anomaloglossus baeobatrachus]|uniref:B-cell receptor CD22-like isoform X2 n=1 Tax=Anomaloglossus baeobatrachus TaxID=238106 RepID=UPI003F4F85B2
MDLIKQIYLLLICQGFYLDSLCQEWRFPRKIVALLGSCVEIPCTYHPDGRSGASSIVWYVSTGGPPDLQILNTKDSSTVIEEYRDRTSLVPGNNSCTLRIDPVRGHDDNIYNPGNGEEKSIYPNIKRSGYVILYVIDRVNIQLFISNLMTEGEATVIQCSVVHTCRSSPPSIQWNKPGQVQNQSVEIFEGSWREESNLTYIPSHMDDGTPIQCTAKHPNGRITERSQTLNINYAATEVHITTKSEGGVTRLICDFLSSRPNVTHYTWMKDGSILQNETGKTLPVDNNEGSYGQYSCIAHNMVGNSSSEGHNDRVNIQLFRSNLMTEGEATVIQCSVVHTWRSSPPSIQWNKPGQVQNQSVEIFEGSWREESNLTYIPSHMDDGTPIQCTAKHPNGRITERSQTLNINYAATEVHITTKSEGEVTRLICDFLSSRPNVTHYTWMKDGSILQNETGKTLPVDNNEGSYGQYSCIAHNMVGNSSSEGHNGKNKGGKKILTSRKPHMPA